MSELTPGFVTIPRIVYDALIRCAEHQADLEQVIITVLDDHESATFGEALGDWCSCGYHPQTRHAWHQHIADHIADQLQENHT